MTNPSTSTQELDANRPHIVILDVGHGNAAFIHENGTSVLIDAAARSHVLEYLRRRAITEIDLVVLSHSDEDHIAGLVGILASGVKVKRVRLNGDAMKDSEIWRDLIFALEDARRAGTLDFEVGISIGQLDVSGFDHCNAEIVGPTPEIAALGVGAMDRMGRKITSNSISACIKVLYQGASVALLSGDMDEIALDGAAQAGTDLSAPLLVFPHHGGLPGKGSAAEFASKLFDMVKPKTVIFSHGRTRHENPRPEIVAEAKKVGAYVVCTQLSRRCSDQETNKESSHLAPCYSAGAIKGQSCGGTVVFYFGTEIEGFLTKHAHEEFVGNAVASPICIIH